MTKNIGGSQLPANPECLRRWMDGQLQGPLVVEVGPTYGCNHNCLHCGFQQFSRYAQEQQFLEHEPFCQFLDDFARLGGREVFFAGHGEPLLNPHLPDWVAYGHGLGLSMVMSTNGVYLTPELSQKILAELRWIRFSVNGGNSQTYAKVHKCPEEDFDRLRENIAFASQYCREAGLKTQLVIQFIAYSVNEDSVEDILAFHEAVGSHKLTIRNVCMKGSGTTQPSSRLISCLEDFSSQQSVDVRWETFFPERAHYEWHKCYGINFRTNLDSRGDLITCNRNLIADSCYGNIKEDRFSAIWSSARKESLFSEIAEHGPEEKCQHWCQSTLDNVYLSQINIDKP